ncbi:hypothetical protein BSL78_15465 [Apostichopus japonicus]|uniref:Reverse transcriptase domain-containing protein n=1 Tax=Stichopus japonicus TaxID=307972 RepID=A0A2G8KI40_STIJA|nr:hypothetical protein BSL78_15465 [Apostichopus japonicus]
MQSAYRANYSTETAQLYVQNSLLCALDERKDALLVLLDFSSAFDTINHQTLLTRLHERYGVDGIPLYWMKSYLANRTQCVIVDQNLSKDVTLATGVPQGSVLGPLLYTLYVAPLHDLIISANMQTVIYADDIQLFTSFHPDHCSDAIQKIQNCIADVKSWAISNNLFINDSKTEILHATSQFKSTTIKSISVKIDQTTITPSTHVKSLGVVLDPHLSMKQQVNAVCKSSYNAVRKISRIRKFLTKDITTKLVCSLIMPRLDYCNSLLFGLPDSTLKKLQTVQNSAARLISCSSRHDHMSPVLQSLHWLPVKHRSIYKLLLLTYKSQHSLALVTLQI